VGIIGGGSLYDYQLSDILPRWVVGIEASITLFDGLSKENKLRAAKSRVDSVNSAVENGRDEIVLLAENEYYNMINALSDIAASRSSIATADSYYYSALEGFRAGVVSSSDLIDAEVARAAAMLTLLNASYEYCCSLARLLEISALSHTFDTYRENGEIIDIKSGLINQ
jgi:outer membrane protein TolC